MSSPLTLLSLLAFLLLMLDYTGVCVCLQTPMYIHVYDAVSNYIYMLLYNFWLLLYLLPVDLSMFLVKRFLEQSIPELCQQRGRGSNLSCHLLTLTYFILFLNWLIYLWLSWVFTDGCGLSLVEAAAAAAKSLQSCPTQCDPIDGSPPGSPIPGILQARTLECVAISSSNAGKWKVKVKSLSHVRLLATPWTAAHQAPPSMGFSRQEYWSGVPLLSPLVVAGRGYRSLQ